MLGRHHCEDDLEGRVGCVVCHLDEWLGGVSGREKGQYKGLELGACQTV